MNVVMVELERILDTLIERFRHIEQILLQKFEQQGKSIFVWGFVGVIGLLLVAQIVWATRASNENKQETIRSNKEVADTMEKVLASLEEIKEQLKEQKSSTDKRRNFHDKLLVDTMERFVQAINKVQTQRVSVPPSLNRSAPVTEKASTVNNFHIKGGEAQTEANLVKIKKKENY